MAGALLAGSATAAFANPVIGTIALSGTGLGVASGIEFTTNPTNSSNGTGIVTGYGGTNNVTFESELVYTSVKANSPQQLLSITSGPNILTFDVNGFNNVSGTFYSIGTVYINGTAVGLGSANENFYGNAGVLGQYYTGTLTITSLTAPTTPEPSSLILLSTGVLCVGAFAWRKRGLSFSSLGASAA
jgi:hypothetical protein